MWIKSMVSRIARYAWTLGWVVGVGVHCLSATGSWAEEDAALPPAVGEQLGGAEAVALAQQWMVRRVMVQQFAVAGDVVVPVEADEEFLLMVQQFAVAANAEILVEAEEGFHLPPEVVNQWIFGGNLQPDDGRKRLDQQLQLRLEEMTDHCHLTQEQLSKLRRAGRGDVIRFLRKVGDVQRLVSGKRSNVDMAQLINDHVQPLQLTLQSGSFGEDSLFHKTTVRVLDPDQQVLFRELTESRRKAIFRSRVELAIGLLERQIPLLDDQRNRLLDLILNENPPATWGRGDLDLLWIHFQISDLPDEQLEEIFTAPQRQMLSAYFRRMGNQRQLLIERGLLDEPGH